MRIFFLAFFVSLNAFSELSNVLTLRSGYEMLANEGTRKGSSTNIGGFNLVYLFPVKNEIMLGFGYSASFDTNKGALPISGYSFHSRYYFLGEGSVDKQQGTWGTSLYKSNRSYYLGAVFNYHSYFLGRDNQAIDETSRLEGKYSNLNVITGADFLLTDKYQVNLELGTSLLTMAASDDRVKIKSTFFLVGLSYFF